MCNITIHQSQRVSKEQQSLMHVCNFLVSRIMSVWVKELVDVGVYKNELILIKHLFTGCVNLRHLI